jgi:kynureninase
MKTLTELFNKYESDKGNKCGVCHDYGDFYEKYLNVLKNHDIVFGLEIGIFEGASLKVFEEAGFKNLLEKSKNLTDYLVFLIKELHESGKINIITPLESPERGCQISLLLKNNGKQVYDGLFKEGVIVDWREPNVIRLAPVPLYNNFVDVFGFSKILRTLLAY